MGKMIVTVLLIAILAFSLGVQQIGLAQDQEKEKVDTGRIMRKLEQVTANQEEIFKQFEEIKRELAVIKVRASRR